MIRKITYEEYLAPAGGMSEADRDAYSSRVGEWLERQAPLLVQRMDESASQFMDAEQCSAVWNDEECRAFCDGARLLTALGTKETWLPYMLYKKSARRAIRHMVEMLSSVAGAGRPEGGAAAHSSHEPEHAAGAGAEHPQASPAAVPAAVRQTPPAAAGHGGAAVPVRPRHIDQYAHLLSPKAQEHAAQVRDILRDLDEARENARRLAEEGDHPDKIALWARKATRLDNALKSIYGELDGEWDRLVEQGRVGVDDMGNAYVTPPGGTATGPEARELTSEQRRRRRERRKFLVDTRRGNGKTRDEHVGKWLEAWKEYLTLEPQEAAMRDEKVVAAMRHYGIEV